jgi:hypothetical protein
VIPANNGNTALMSFIERAAKDPEFDVAKFGELLRLQRDVAHDQARRAFNAAMADAQAEMLPVVRDAKNNHLGNRYAKLETIDAAMRPIYTRHGFSVRYGSAPAPAEGYIRLTCTVAHAAGYFEENYLDAPLGTHGSQGGRTATTPVQSVGSAVTYLRRYLLGMVFNIVLADDDDDGEAVRQKAAAVSVPRAARIAERATTYEAGPASPVERTDEAWRIWLVKLRDAVGVLRNRGEVEQVAVRDTVGNALRDGPPWVKREIDDLLADAFERFPAQPEPELPEVEIAGQENMASG